MEPSMNENVRPATPVARVVLASFIGTSIEWYDFFLYGMAAALVFNKLFFPALDPLAGTMASFATNAVGFFARPLGGIVFGHYGDKIGRKATLVTTLLMMGLSTFLIGALPTYDQIGVLAPVALVALRFRPGAGRGRRVGRRRAARGGARSPKPPGLLRQCRPGRRARRPPTGQRRLRGGLRPPRRAVFELGLARAVPWGRRLAGAGPVHPPAGSVSVWLRNGQKTRANRSN
jgi:MFS family permease